MDYNVGDVVIYYKGVDEWIGKIATVLHIKKMAYIEFFDKIGNEGSSAEDYGAKKGHGLRTHLYNIKLYEIDEYEDWED